MADTEPFDVIRRIKRGLTCYVGYLAACEMNEAFSEYVLYEPILRILTARNFSVQSEVECPGISQPRVGDKKRLDFVVKGKNLHFSIEVKWALTKKNLDGVLTRHPVDISTDLAKLKAFKDHESGNRSFLCVFGTKTSLVPDVTFASNSDLVGRLNDHGIPVIADLAQTRYGCRFYEFI